MHLSQDNAYIFIYDCAFLQTSCKKQKATFGEYHDTLCLGVFEESRAAVLQIANYRNNTALPNLQICSTISLLFVVPSYCASTK